MKNLENRIKILKKDIDNSFTITVNGRTFVNYTCGPNKMVIVNYFALQALLDFYEETKAAASKVIIAREALAYLYWNKEPIPEKQVK